MRHSLVTTTVGIVIGAIGGVILSVVKPKWATAVALSLSAPPPSQPKP